MNQAGDMSMGDGPRPGPDAEVGAARAAARARLTRRLSDIVCLPASAVSPPERWVVADVLAELLRDAETGLRARVARRLAGQVEAPGGLLRRLSMDVFEVAEPILEESLALSDFDMMEIARKCGPAHQLALARREHVSETVAAALVFSGQREVIEALLRNAGARLAPQTVDHLLPHAVDAETVAALLVKRTELRPRQAFRLFWDCGQGVRKLILDRFAVGRSVLQEAAEDVFPVVAAEREAPPDPAMTRALGYIDRRQRDRDAERDSAFDGLESVIRGAAVEGFTDALLQEGARFSRVGPRLLKRIAEDLGGEPLGVFAKAQGLDRDHLDLAVRACDGPGGEARRMRARTIYDTLSTDKAQTVLRYWCWADES